MNPKKNSSLVDFNFQPMPKRFKIWDNLSREWLLSGVAMNAENVGKVVNGAPQNAYEIVQSTNLFDKNGKEIFEGSILQGRDNCLSVVQYDGDEGMFRTNDGIVLEDMSCGGDYFEVMGHILSNPELWENSNG